MVEFMAYRGCPECGWPVPIVMFTGLCTECSVKDHARVREEARAHEEAVLGKKVDEDKLREAVLRVAREKAQ